MITFEPLWNTLKEKGISQYKLIKEYNISTGQLDRLRKNGNVNTYTLNQLCKILHCKLEDIAIYTDASFTHIDNHTKTYFFVIRDITPFVESIQNISFFRNLRCFIAFCNVFLESKILLSYTENIH